MTIGIEKLRQYRDYLENEVRGYRNLADHESLHGSIVMDARAETLEQAKKHFIQFFQS